MSILIQNRGSAKPHFVFCGPEENRTPDSAMRMLRNTTLLQALVGEGGVTRFFSATRKTPEF